MHAVNPCHFSRRRTKMFSYKTSLPIEWWTNTIIEETSNHSPNRTTPSWITHGHTQIRSQHLCTVTVNTNIIDNRQYLSTKYLFSKAQLVFLSRHKLKSKIITTNHPRLGFFFANKKRMVSPSCWFPPPRNFSVF